MAVPVYALDTSNASNTVNISTDINPAISAVNTANEGVMTDADAAATETLTVDQATRAAINASSDLKNYSDNAASNNDSLDILKDEFNTVTDYGTVLNLAVQIMQTQVANIQTDNNANLATDKLRISVMNLFATIISAQKSLELTDQSLSIQKRQLDIAKVKYSEGYISRLDMDTQTNSYSQNLASRETQSINISNAFISLNKLMGYSLNRQYNLILDFEYEPIGNVNLSGAVDTAIRADPGVINQQGNVNVAQYQIQMYDSDVSSQSLDSLNRSLEQAQRNLSDTQSGVAQKVTNAYNSIKNQEIQYGNAVLALDSLYNQVPLKIKQVELGKTTQLDLDQLYLQIAQQQETIRDLTVSHTINVIQFQEPATL